MDVAVTDDVNANKDILTLQEAIECFDNGKIFLGSFPECPSSTSSSGGVEKVEGCARRSLQLLSQMSVTEPSLLNILFGIYGASSVAATELRYISGILIVITITGSNTVSSVKSLVYKRLDFPKLMNSLTKI